MSEEALLEAIGQRLTEIERPPPAAGFRAGLRDVFARIGRPIAENEIELVNRERPLHKLKASGRRNPLAIPAVSHNVVLNRLAFALLEHHPNLKGTVYGIFLQTGEFDPEADFDFRFAPFVNLVPDDAPARHARSVLAGLDPTDDDAFAHHLDEVRREIFEFNLLGRNTRSKFGALAGAHREAAGPAALRNLARTYLFHLVKYRKSLAREALAKEQDERHSKRRSMLLRLLLAYRLNELSRTAWGPLTLDRTLALYRDELAAILAPINAIERPARDCLGSYHLQFVPRNADYFLLGSRYGDCTAHRRLKQNFDVENIFWTNAAWIFDPFYQILELRKGHVGLIKAHLHIAFLCGQLVLNVDAIETAPQMRPAGDTEIRTDRRPNLDEESYPERARLLRFVLDRVLALAEAMGIDGVVCELFSNTAWVREAMAVYPRAYYPIRDYRSLYDGALVCDIARRLLPELQGTPIDLKAEIQATNTNLFDLGLKPGYKSCAILRGKINGVPFRQAMRAV